jgi:hypothetical protein
VTTSASTINFSSGTTGIGAAGTPDQADESKKTVQSTEETHESIMHAGVGFVADFIKGK